jgi:hypothetical protein
MKELQRLKTKHIKVEATIEANNHKRFSGPKHGPFQELEQETVNVRPAASTALL